MKGGFKGKVLLSVPNLGIGGAQRQTVEIANGLCAKGFCCVIFAFRGGEIEGETGGGVKVVKPEYPAFAGKFRFLSLTFGLFEFVRTVLREKPDFLYSRHWTKIANTVAGKVFGIKTVWTEGNGGDFLRRQNRLLFFAHKFFVRFAGVVTANSKGLAEEIKETYGLKTAPAVIYNGVNAQSVRRKSTAGVRHKWLEERIPVAVSTGRIVRQKGFSALIDAVKTVNRKTPLRLIIIGDGNIREDLIRRARNAGIGDKTDFIGSEPNPHRYTARCDVFVCPSEREGFSNSLAEAAALGMPIVSTNHPFGADEIIENGKNGFLVPVGDSEAMAEAILKLIENKTLAEEMGKAAKKRAEDFGVEKMTEEYQKLFSKD